jgi:hypothetical protein
VLKIVKMAGEKSAEMEKMLKDVLTDNNLDLKKMISITMDNTNANFGGQFRGGQENLFYRLRKGRNFIENTKYLQYFL